MRDNPNPGSLDSPATSSMKTQRTIEDVVFEPLRGQKRLRIVSEEQLIVQLLEVLDKEFQRPNITFAYQMVLVENMAALGELQKYWK